jgi:N-acetylmuramoyl-L-alanine amidase/AmpD protein
MPDNYSRSSPAIVPRRPRRSLLARRRRRRLLFTLMFAMAGLVLCGRVAQTVRAMRQPALPPVPLAYSFHLSPNCDDRPPDTVINCVVIHATVLDSVEETVQTFLNPAKKVSAHFVVGREGQVVQMVPVEKRAWHAGLSALEGVPHVNDYSVGIEIVNRNDGKDPFTDAQYEAVAGIIRFLRARYALPDSRLVSHAAIARPVGRKSDPLGFDFARLCALAK